MKKIFFALLVPALLTACMPIVRVGEDAVQAVGGAAPSDRYPVTIENVNANGEPETEVYDAPPQRIVAVWQNSIETPLALGAGDRIIAGMGIPDRKYLKPEYRDLYDRIPYTSLENLDVETILMMEPDLIIGWASTFSPKVLRGTEFWQSRGIHTYIAPSSAAARTQKTVDDELRYIRDLGRIIGRTDEAAVLERQIERELHVPHGAADAPPRVLVIASVARDLRIYTPRTLSGDLLGRLGAEVLGKEEERVGEEEFISYEQLLMMDPDVIFVQSSAPEDTSPRDRLCRHPALRDLQAVRSSLIESATRAPGQRSR